MPTASSAEAERASHPKNIDPNADVRSPQADSDLDDIWYYIATETGSADVADRVIDGIVQRFLLLAKYPRIGRTRDEIRRGLRVFPSVSMSSSIASSGKT